MRKNRKSLYPAHITSMKALLLLFAMTLAAQAADNPKSNFLAVVRGYADAMLEHGRDVYGPRKSGLFLSALDRSTLGLLKVRPAPPGGIRRGDRPGRPWSEMNGANPQLDQNLLRILYTLTEITGDRRYAKAADEELTWFFKNTMSPKTSLLPWGEHLSWDVVYDIPISGGDEVMHEFARPWVLWDRCFQLVPEASSRFALGLWEHQIANHKTGGFDRHAPYHQHGPVEGKDFARHAGFYISTWCYGWKHTTNQTFLQAIEVLLARYERKRMQKDGSMIGTIGPLDCGTAASMVPEPLSTRLRRFAKQEDELTMPLLKRIMSGGTNAPPKWESGYAENTLASWAMFCLARYEQTSRPEYRHCIIQIAEQYLDARPEEDVDAWPLSFAHAISAEVAAYRFTKRPAFLDGARRSAKMAVQIFWQDHPLPRASMQTGHYETITGADSLALALLQVHAIGTGLTNTIPPNTIDR